MTAQAIAYAEPDFALRTAPPARPRLRLVDPDKLAGPVAPYRARRRVRLTARGRLVRTLLTFGALCLLALVALARLSAPALPPSHAVTVDRGDTLTQIAAEELPMVPVEAAVVRIQLANGLNGTHVVAGQNLVIPGS